MAVAALTLSTAVLANATAVHVTTRNRIANVRSTEAQVRAQHRRRRSAGTRVVAFDEAAGTLPQEPLPSGHRRHEKYPTATAQRTNTSRNSIAI